MGVGNFLHAGGDGFVHGGQQHRLPAAGHSDVADYTSSIVKVYAEAESLCSCSRDTGDEKSNLQRSLSLAAPAINGEYSHGVQHFGGAFVEGDHYARVTLESICKTLREAVLLPLQHGCGSRKSRSDDLRGVEYGRILSCCNNEKAKTLACLNGLRERLAKRGQSDRAPRNPFRNHHHNHNSSNRNHHYPSCLNTFTFFRNCNSRSNSTCSRPVSPLSHPSSSRRSSVTSAKPIPISYPNSNASSRQNSCAHFADAKDRPAPRKPNVVDVSWVEYDDDDDLPELSGADIVENKDDDDDDDDDDDNDYRDPSPTKHSYSNSNLNSNSPMDDGFSNTRSSYIPPSALEETKLSVSAASPNARGFLYRSMMADKEKEENERDKENAELDINYEPPESQRPSEVDALANHSTTGNGMPHKEADSSSISLWDFGKEKVMRPIKEKNNSKDGKSRRNPLQYLAQRKASDPIDSQYEHMKDALPSNILPKGQVPSHENHFLGLCEGAWYLQAYESSLDNTPDSNRQVSNSGNGRIWKCRSCSFEIASTSATPANSATQSTSDSKHTNNSSIRAGNSLWEGLKSLNSFSFGSTSSKRNASSNPSPATSRSNSASASTSPVLLPIQGSFHWTSPSSSRRPSANTVNESSAPNMHPCSDYDWDVSHEKDEPWQLHEQTGIRYRWTFLAKSHVRHSHFHFPTRSNTVPHRGHNRPRIRWNSIQDGPVYRDFEVHGSGFVCLFCTLDPPTSAKSGSQGSPSLNGRADTPTPTVYGTVDELLQHLRRHDGAKMPGRYRKAPRKEVRDHLRCVLGKSWLQKEVKLEFDGHGSRPVEWANDDQMQSWDLWIPPAMP